MTYIIAADTGGTFTDLAAYDAQGRRVVYAKTLTTYGDLVKGVMECVSKAKIDLARAAIIKFGTTLVINTFVQRNGSRTALITTKGFRDTLEIRRGNRSVPFDLRYKREPALAERDVRLEISERISAEGQVLAAIDFRELDAAAALLRKLEVEAVAVSFLNSYKNDEHEAAAAARLRELLPDLYVTCGVELSREWHEYERTSTAVANAYVGPKLQDYVKRLEGRLRSGGFEQAFYLMASNGGVVSAARAQQQPVMLVESGPVGGCIGAGAYAEALGIRNAVAFDMGGTTAKCALLENGSFDIKSPYYIGGEQYGFPIRGSILDIVEVGTGGGSIAWVDEHGRLQVGPKSAGSNPGPACYGAGGTDPTITDANLVLGRIGSSSFLGGEIRLDIAAAETAVGLLASKLGFYGADGLDQMAQGILTLSAMTMASAIKQITVERGLDPRKFSLIAFGGGGPLHSATLARMLNLNKVVIPPEPGIFSAVGMLLADARLDESQTFLREVNGDSLAEMLAVFAAMESRIRDQLKSDFGATDVTFERNADIRFHGQRQAMRTSIGAASDPATLRDLYETAYKRHYGHVRASGRLELVSLAVTGRARVDGPELACLGAMNDERPCKPDLRSVYFAEVSGRLETPVYQRLSLQPGFTTAGPAIIEEYGSTTVVGPKDEIEVRKLGELHIWFKD